MYTRLVVPLDGSALAAQALPQATMLAQRGVIPLHLVRVVELPPLARAGLAEFREDVAAAAADLTQVAARLQAEGLSVTTEVRPGDVVDELLAVAEPGDLYVLATHGRTGVTRWLLGSVAEALARRSVVPVLLVRMLVPSRVVKTETRAPATVPAAQPAHA